MTVSTDRPHDQQVTVHINGTAYRYAPGPVTPGDIRRIPNPDIPSSKQIWLDIDDALDRLIGDSETIDLVDGMHFYSETPAIAIHIDRTAYEVHERKMAGARLRTLPSPDVAEDRDLWLDVPDRRDIKVQDEDVIALRNGTRFFTAPGRINPGADPASHKVGR